MTEADAPQPNATEPCLGRRPARSEFLDVRGLRMHLRIWGDVSLASAERPSLVLLHGWMDVAASFQFMVDAMDDSRHIVAVDWRGFGLSQASGADSYWFPDYMGDLDGVLTMLSAMGELSRSVDLLGHSMGGNVAMLYAGIRPNALRRLINLEGFGQPGSVGSQAPARYARWLDELKTPERMRRYDSVEQVAARLGQTNPHLSPQRAAWLAPHWARQAPDGLWEILGDPAHKRSNPVLYRQEEALACWAAITVPVLWVEGSRTRMSQFWGDRYTRAEFDARLTVVKQLEQITLADAGHMLHHDQPEALAAAVERFLG